MLDLIPVDIKQFIDVYAKEYPMVAGAVSLWALGVLSYTIRGVPEFLFQKVKKIFTIKIDLVNSNESFYSFLTWYQVKGYAKKGRFLKITNGRFGNDTMMKSLGYGRQIFWYKKHPLLLDMQQQTNSTSDKERDQITITSLGRSHKIFDSLFQEVSDGMTRTDVFVMMKFSQGRWYTSSELRFRNFDTLFFKKGLKDTILNYLDDFQTKEDWYIKKEIPYQLGILLYGPPGTGKTSIIKAVAAYLNYQVYVLSPSELGNIEEAVFNLPEKSLLVIEDIDTCSVTNKRSFTTEEKISDDLNVSSKKMLEIANLSNILNSIDGIHQVHGRIIIATTNHIENLDEALVRGGRFDLKIEVGYVDKFILVNMFNNFYPNYTISDNFKIKNKISTAYIQNLILKNLDNPDEVLNTLEAIPKIKTKDIQGVFGSIIYPNLNIKQEHKLTKSDLKINLV